MPRADPRRVDRYVTWGNHEADLSHEDVMCRVEEYQGATQLQLRRPCRPSKVCGAFRAWRAAWL